MIVCYRLKEPSLAYSKVYRSWQQAYKLGADDYARYKSKSRKRRADDARSGRSSIDEYTRTLKSPSKRVTGQHTFSTAEQNGKESAVCLVFLSLLQHLHLPHLQLVTGALLRLTRQVTNFTGRLTLCSCYCLTQSASNICANIVLLRMLHAVVSCCKSKICCMCVALLAAQHNSARFQSTNSTHPTSSGGWLQPSMPPVRTYGSWQQAPQQQQQAPMPPSDVPAFQAAVAPHPPFQNGLGIPFTTAMPPIQASFAPAASTPSYPALGGWPRPPIPPMLAPAPPLAPQYLGSGLPAAVPWSHPTLPLAGQPSPAVYTTPAAANVSSLPAKAQGKAYRMSVLLLSSHVLCLNQAHMSTADQQCKWRCQGAGSFLGCSQLHEHQWQLGRSQ